MSAIVFVDTNVLIYARDARDSGKQATAAAWLERLWLEQRGRTSMQVLGEYYAVATKKLKPGLAPDAAWDDVVTLLAWEPQPIDADTLTRARTISERYRLSWWDSLVVAAAQLQNCSLLLTEDLQHGLDCDGVTVHNPFLPAIAEPRADYAIPQRATRHRGRGRPRTRAPL